MLSTVAFKFNLRRYRLRLRRPPGLPRYRSDCDSATTSTMVVSKPKRRSLFFVFDDVNHYYPDGTPMVGRLGTEG